MGDDEHPALEAFLETPAAYGLADEEPVERIDTHISTVFLAGERAYKLKKPVDFGYLDFTTCEKRHEACRHELELNRRTAPDLYLRVLPVRRTAQGYALGEGEGPVADWLLEMQRFDQDDLLAAKADAGTLSRETIEDLAAFLADFHQTAEVRRDSGGAARFARVLASNEENYAPFVGPVYDATLIERLEARARTALDGIGPLLDARRDAGWVRHCHGDLHLANVTLWKGKPVPFDCIEFNDDFARIDILYDLAFLLMDLVFRAGGSPALSGFANAALNRYLQSLPQHELAATLEGLRALPFFMSARAGVRSHVTARTWSGVTEAGRREDLAGRAVAYADLAIGLLEPQRPVLVAVGGLSGTGKTTLARELAPLLPGPAGAVHLRTDVLRKKLAGVPETERLPASAYTPAASQAVYDEMTSLTKMALAAGQTVICDAVFARPGERGALEQVARDAGTAFKGLWLTAGADVMTARVEERGRHGRDASDATPEVVRTQLSYDLGEIGWDRVDARGTPPDVCQRAAAFLNHTQP